MQEQNRVLEFSDFKQFADLVTGEKIAYLKLGKGKQNIFLIHGWGQSSLVWIDFVKPFLENYLVILVDWRGHGDSTYNTKSTTIQETAIEIALLCQSLGLKEIFLGGWSLGGAISYQLAIMFPSLVKKLILFSSVSAFGFFSFKYDNNSNELTQERNITKQDAEEQSNNFRSLIQKTKQDDLKSLLLCSGYKNPNKYYFSDVQNQKNSADATFMSYSFDISGEGPFNYRKIVCPLLMIHGDSDNVCQIQYAKDSAKLFQQIKEIQFEIIQGGTHWLVQDNEKEIQEITLKFLQKQNI